VNASAESVRVYGYLPNAAERLQSIAESDTSIRFAMWRLL